MEMYARICAASVEEFLARSVRKGSLTLRMRDGERDGDVLIFGQTAEKAVAAGHPVASLNVYDAKSFYVRITSAADIGLAEAFIVGDFLVDHPSELTNLFKILILNRDAKTLSASGLALSWLGSKLNRLLHAWNANSMTGSQRNIEAHYDLSNELFGLFLGRSWTYSCAYFGDGGEANPCLDAAQHAKIDMVLDQARVGEGMHVLDIGCGWGELAIRAARTRGCRVTGITLSHEQLGLARARATEAGVDDLVSFELLDYRLLSTRPAAYDRIVSVEMLEAVGHEYLDDFFEAVEACLAPGGLIALQVITTPEERYESYRASTDFIQKHIFPGGLAPSFAALVAAMARGAPSLSVERASNIGPHYATTLSEWRRRFLDSVKAGRVAAAGFGDRFVRKWTYYLCYCEAGFATRTLGLMQVVLSRPRNVGVLGGAPEIVREF